MDEWRSENLLAALVALMPAGLVRKHLGHSSFDKALREILLHGHLPEWFSDYVSWDPIYGVSPELRFLIALAIRDRLIDYEMSCLDYLSALKREQALELAEDLGLDGSTVQHWADQLSARLAA